MVTALTPVPHSPVATSRYMSPHSSSAPFVTVAIPTFNRASWLRECALSALAQTYPHLEVVISDNASTDGTPDVLQAFSDHPKVRLVRQSKNIGLVPNFNACLAQAKGQYIVIVCDDDRIAPWLLERCMGVVKDEPTVPIVLALNQTYLPADGRTLPPISSRRLTTGVWDGPDVLREYLSFNISVQLCTVMFRTDALRDAGGFPVELPYSSAPAAWTELLFGRKAGLVNEPCGTFTWHDSSQTSRFPVNQRLEDERRLLDRILRLADRQIEDVRKRSEIKAHAQRYFAQGAIWIITNYRRSGATLLMVLRLLWRWRHDLRHIGLSQTIYAIRPIVLLLVPSSVANWIRRLKGTYRGKPVWKDSSTALGT